MNRMIRMITAAVLLLSLTIMLSGCGGTQTEEKAAVTASFAVAGDYYLDLTDLGMKLTVFLHLEADGGFAFANSLSFENIKSAGTYQNSEDGYLMVFTNVNGEERSISEGLTSGFNVLEDGSLDFSRFGTVPYGSANITTVSAEDASIKLIAHPVTEDYVAPSTDSEFRMGLYTAQTQEGSHAVSFFEDNTYLHVMRWEKEGRMNIACEIGSYGVSTTQLALEPENGDRVQCEVVDGDNLKLSVLPAAGAAERAMLDFSWKETPAQIAALSGTGVITGSPVSFAVSFTVYEDGAYIAVADGYEEKGMIVIDTDTSYAKQYPDHPSTGMRGISQVSTVPYAVCGYDENGKLTLTDIRVCTSPNLTRFKATVAE